MSRYLAAAAVMIALAGACEEGDSVVEIIGEARHESGLTVPLPAGFEAETQGAVIRLREVERLHRLAHEMGLSYGKLAIVINRRRKTELPEGVEGAWAVADERIEPGAQGRATLRGTPWTARNDGDTAIEAGARFKVERAEGVILRVRGDLEED